MAEKTRIIEIHEKEGAFTSVLKRFTGPKKEEKSEYNYKDLSILRKLLSNEKARMLNVIKNKKPKSLYHLSKLLNRDFKSVREDIILLKKFGFIDLIEDKNKSGKKISHRPVLNASTVSIVIRI